MEGATTYLTELDEAQAKVIADRREHILSHVTEDKPFKGCDECPKHGITLEEPYFPPAVSGNPREYFTSADLDAKVGAKLHWRDPWEYHRLADTPPDPDGCCKGARCKGDHWFTLRGDGSRRCEWCGGVEYSERSAQLTACDEHGDTWCLALEDGRHVAAHRCPCKLNPVPDCPAHGEEAR